MKLSRLSPLNVLVAIFLGVSTGGAGPPASSEHEILTKNPRREGNAAAKLLHSASQLYVRCAPAVVALTCRKGRSESYYGTGTIVDPGGIVLTSTTVVPGGARDVRAYLPGGRTAKARVVTTLERLELALVRIERAAADRDSGTFPFIPLGDSTSTSLGEPAFTFGNTFHSIERDAQVAMSEGVVSGYFKLGERRSQSTYVGLALETSARINSGMDGGPLVNANGEVIGLLSLNYSRNRWLGTAVPIHLLAPLIRPYRSWLDDRKERFAAFLGLSVVEDRGGRVKVVEVHENGPAHQAGLRPGMLLTHVEDEEIDSVRELRSALESARPGATWRVGFRKTANDEPQSAATTLWGRF